jgi:hypothetical protein
MLSIYNLFVEIANVHSEHPSGLIAPFGVVDPRERNKKLLAKAQDFSTKDPSEQVKLINKLTV